jgi:hypothetical protein
MKKGLVLSLVLLGLLSSVCYGYDLETLMEARYRNVDITLKDGTNMSGYVWDIIKVNEEQNNAITVSNGQSVSYGSIISQSTETGLETSNKSVFDNTKIPPALVPKNRTNINNHQRGFEYDNMLVKSQNNNEEVTTITKPKYYLLIRKGVIEYQVDADTISLLGVQKW